MYYIRQILEFELPSVAEDWQPHMLMNYRRYVDRPPIEILNGIARSTNCRTLLKTLLRAKRELDSVGWKGSYSSDIVRDSEDKEGAVRLANVRALSLRCNVYSLGRPLADIRGPSQVP